MRADGCAARCLCFLGLAPRVGFPLICCGGPKHHHPSTCRPSNHRLHTFPHVLSGRFGDAAVPIWQSMIPKSSRCACDKAIYFIAYQNASSHRVDMPVLRGACLRQSHTAVMAACTRRGDDAEASAVAHGAVVPSRKRTAEECTKRQTSAQKSQ